MVDTSQKDKRKTRKVENYDMLFKIVLIGESGVGKTQLLSRFTKDEFSEKSSTTIGMEFAVKNTKVEDKVIKTQIWDTAGQERYRAIANSYYKGAVGALLVYDLTNYQSFENAKVWLKELKNNASENLTLILLGNKVDMASASRQVQSDEAAEFAEKQQMAFLETSAKDATNVNNAFQCLISEIYDRQTCDESDRSTIVTNRETVKDSNQMVSSDSRPDSMNTSSRDSKPLGGESGVRKVGALSKSIRLEDADQDDDQDNKQKKKKKKSSCC